MVTYEVFVGTMLSMLLLGAGAFYWLMLEMRGLCQEIRELRAELRSEIRSETQRILEALYFHRHDEGGAAVFYPPTSSD